MARGFLRMTVWQLEQRSSLKPGSRISWVLQPPTNHLVALENQHAVPRLGEIRATGEAVVTRAGNDEVEALDRNGGGARSRFGLIGGCLTGDEVESCHQGGRGRHGLHEVTTRDRGHFLLLWD